MNSEATKYMKYRVWKPKEILEEIKKVSNERRSPALEHFFYVEANYFEKMKLWEEWNSILPWEDVGQGVSLCIGTLSKRPVMLSFFFAVIAGKMICFYDATSALVDHFMVEKVINTIAPKWDAGKRVARCDAMNFHLCVDAIREKMSKKDRDILNKAVSKKVLA